VIVDKKTHIIKICLFKNLFRQLKRVWEHNK